MLNRLKLLARSSAPVAWGLLIALLPVTSLPLLARLTGASSVSTAAAIPLAWLVLVWFIPYLVTGGKLPRLTLAYLGLLTVFGLSSLLAYFNNIPFFSDRSVAAREIEALFTLGVGAAFYLVASSWPVNEKRLRTTLQILNWSGLVMLLWSFLQAYFWFRTDSIPDVMTRIQHIFSVNEFFYHRVNGFAFEPSWYAHLLNMQYLPFWLSATVLGTSVHRFRLARLSLENILFGLGVATLFLSFSRVGLIGFLLVVAYLGIWGAVALGRKIQRWWYGRMRGLSPAVNRYLIPAAILFSFLVVFLGGSLGIVWEASHFDPRLAKIFQRDTWTTNLYRSANNLEFAERMVFWATGWKVFNEHPIFGVGLGNAGFYFQQQMPGFGWSLTEVNTVMFRSTAIPNTKSLWARILAEGGLFGFAFWLGWLYLVWRAARQAYRSGKPLVRTIGLAGTLVLVALLSEGFSVDSFALPFLWISCGLVTATTRISDHVEPATVPQANSDEMSAGHEE